MVERTGARVLLVDARGRVLMLRGHDPATPEVQYWFTIGGGVDEGESDRDAAVRELFEETGLRADADSLVGPVHSDVAEFPFDGRVYRQSQVYFLLRVDSWDVDTSGFNVIEQATVEAWRWWSAGELRAADESWYPPELADLLDRLLENPA